MLKSSLVGVAAVALGLGICIGPAKAIPDASSAALAGATVGAEAGFLGTKVNKGIPYYIYASGGVLHLLSLKGELLNGPGRADFKNVAAQINVLPLPFITVAAEPGISWFGNGAGPSLGVRGTGSLPLTGLSLSAYARIHYVHSTTTGEFGAGLTYPIASLLKFSLSAIDYTSGSEPRGILFLAGLKAHFGI